jgi:hypothetical protein
VSISRLVGRGASRIFPRAWATSAASAGLALLLLAPAQGQPRQVPPSVDTLINRAQQGQPLAQPNPPLPSQPSGPLIQGGAQGSDVADTLAKAGVRPTPDTLTGNNEKTADDTLYKVEQSTGLPAPLRDLKDQVPPNADELIKRLGLHNDPAVRIDFRNRTPSPEEIVQALRPQ